jgi:rubrerythrin
MDSSIDSETVCEMLAQNEERLSRLYGVYAEKFPKYRDLWNGLAEEETKHAAWIRKLASWVKEGVIDINADRFNISAIRTFSNYVDKELTNVKTSNVSSINALVIASYIEDSIIEHNYFEVFEGDSLELRNTLIDLANETNKHRNIVKEALKEAKASGL